MQIICLSYLLTGALFGDELSDRQHVTKQMEPYVTRGALLEKIFSTAAIATEFAVQPLEEEEMHATWKCACMWRSVQQNDVESGGQGEPCVIRGP